MRRTLDWLQTAYLLADQVLDARRETPLGRLWARFRRRLTGAETHEESLGQIDGALLQDTLATLREMLVEMNERTDKLPDDVKPIGLAARGLLERSIEECAKPRVNSLKLAKDMQQFGRLAAAMRERLLLSNWSKTPDTLN